MNSSSQRWGVKVALGLGFLAVASLAAVIFYERSRHDAAVRELKRERAELTTQLEARDLAIANLKSEVLNLRAIVGAPSRSRVSSRATASSEVEADLRRRIAELQASHSNVVAVAESLASERVRSAAEEERKVREAALADLESSATEALQSAEAARQKAEDLAVALNVPADIAAMDADTALESANLRTYWPYFESKRERDTLQRTAEALRLRLLQETADAAADATRSTPQ